MTQSNINALRVVSCLGYFYWTVAIKTLYSEGKGRFNGRASGKRGIGIIQIKKITAVLRSYALSVVQSR